MKKFYSIAIKEIVDFMRSCNCQTCNQTLKLLLEKNTEVN